MAQSQVTTISQNIRYLKAIDSLNAKIIQECCRQGPNNLSSIARSLKIPIETVRYRFQKLRRIGVFDFDVFARYSKLGLIRCSVFANTIGGGGSTLEGIFSTIPYWTYLARCFGHYEGYYGVFALPYANRSDFEQYWEEAQKLSAVGKCGLVFTGDSYSIAPSFKWFNFKKHFWEFPWEEWVKAAESSPASTHPSLVDPKEYNSHLDDADIKILELLEIDAARGFREIGRHLGFTAAGVKYHWDNHIMRQGVVEGFRTVTSGYPIGFSDLFTFHLQFRDAKSLARLTNFLSDKVFVVSFTKVLRANQLIVHIRVPKTEFERMMSFMHGARECGLVEDFAYVKLDLSSYSAYTIRPPNFKNGYWQYDYDYHLERLRSLSKGRTVSHDVDVLAGGPGHMAL